MCDDYLTWLREQKRLQVLRRTTSIMASNVIRWLRVPGIRRLPHGGLSPRQRLYRRDPTCPFFATCLPSSARSSLTRRSGLSMLMTRMNHSSGRGQLVDELMSEERRVGSTALALLTIVSGTCLRAPLLRAHDPR